MQIFLESQLVNVLITLKVDAWEALEQLKEDVNYPDMIRLIESMQAAVEKIPIADAFDELDTERDYYQARRKESNERLISKKGTNRKSNRIYAYDRTICMLFSCSIGCNRSISYERFI